MLDKVEKFDKILETDFEKEIDRIISNGTINPTEVKTVTDALCLMLKSIEYQDYLHDEEDGYSERSYRRGRSPVTGRYVSRRGPEMSMRYDDPCIGHSMNYGHGSYSHPMSRNAYDNGYSGHSIEDRMVAELERMMDQAQSEYERQTIMSEIRAIRARN